MYLFTARSPHQTVHSRRAETVPVLLEALPPALDFTAFLAECHALPQPQVSTPEEGLGKPFVNVIQWSSRHTQEDSGRNRSTDDSADY